MKFIAHNVLPQWDILPRVENLKNSWRFIKSQSPWGGVQ